MTGQTLVVTQKVVERHPHLHLAAVKKAAAVERYDELEWSNQMRRDAQKRFPFAQVHTYEAKIKHLEITQAAMDQPRRSGGCAAAEIPFFKQGNSQTAKRSVTRDAGADDAAADDNHIELLACELRKSGRRI